LINGLDVLKEPPQYLLLDPPTSSDVLQGQRSQPAERHEDPELSNWLRLYGADQDSIDRVSVFF